MADQIPLIIVIITIASLWAAGKYLSRLSQGITVIAPTSSVPQGKIFADGLHIADMSNVLMRELQETISRQDDKELVYFLARYRPNLVELEKFFDDLRSQYYTLLGKPSKLATEAEKITAINEIQLDAAPACIDINALNKAELRSLIENNLKTNRLITSDFMERFGGRDFMDNFQVYAQLVDQQPVTIHANSEHQYRRQLEAFVKTGIAQQGRKIPLKARLEVLSFNQLKDMLRDLKITTEFSTKSELSGALAQMPGSAVHLSMIYEPDDIFYIKAEAADAKSIEDEWYMLHAYARLLIESLKNSFVTFDEVAV
ncbi:MAG: hypothetical protein L0Z73_07670 [Gammaproteobacteria bacterium]|nr:hypothetical protein [Gammaproteobacteria bacterium]